MKRLDGDLASPFLMDSLIQNRKTWRELLNHLSTVFFQEGEYKIDSLECLQFVPTNGKGEPVLLSEVLYCLNLADRPANKKGDVTFSEEQVKKDIESLW